jgi:hypothetical protein
MANTDKNITIRPRTGDNSLNPVIEFDGASGSTGAQQITLTVLPDDDGTLILAGSGGDIFEITDNGIYSAEVTGDLRVSGTIVASTGLTIGSDTIAEYVSDTVGAMISGGSQSGITVDYLDADNTIDFNVDDFSITLTGDVAGTGTVTNLGNVSFAATIQADSVALGTDTTGNYMSGISGTANEVEVTHTAGEGSSATVGLPDSVSITSNLTLGGYLAGPTSFTIDPSTVGDDTGTVIIAGNLTVNGTTTQVNSTTVNIADNNILLNSNHSGPPTANAGITVERGSVVDALLQWNEGSDYWELSGPGTTTGRILTTGDEGTGNGLDADTLDSQEGTYYLDHTNFTNVPDPVVTVTLTGAVTGTATATLTNLGNATATVATTATSDPTLTLSGDVSGSATFTNLGNATLTATVANDSHTHAFNNLTSKTSGTGDYATTGDLQSGKGSGGVAMTINDGYGNANLTFNHRNGTPEQAGNAARIEVNTDSTSGASMNFEVKSNVAANSAIQTTTILNLAETNSTFSTNLLPSANNTKNLGASGTVWNTVYATLFNGTALEAYYADLAENYLGDKKYEPGTVVVFGGSEEVTTTDQKGNFRIAGVVSTDAAYLMNSGLEGDTVMPIALQGRVPCKVIGKVEKGDMLVTSAISGYAMVDNRPSVGTVIGKAVGTKDTSDKGVVEVVVGRS